MQEFNKQFFIKQCYFCKYLEMKQIDIKTKDTYIQCCGEVWHKLTNLKHTPKNCPYYIERFMLSNY